MAESKEWITDNEAELTRLRESYIHTYEVYQDTQTHFETFRKVQSEVDNLLKDDVFKKRNQTFFRNNPLAKSFLESGVLFPIETSAASSDVQKALFWSGLSLNILMQAYSGVKLVETFRMGRIIRSQAQALNDIDDFLASAYYRPGSSLRRPLLGPKPVSAAPAKVGRLTRLKRFMKSKLVPKAFRSSSHLRAKVENKAIRTLNKIPVSKVAVAMATISLGLQAVSQVFAVVQARDKLTQYNKQANKMREMVKELKNMTKELPKQEEKMEELTQNMAGIVQYLLEEDGYMCEVDSSNVLAAVIMLKDRAIDTLKECAISVERYKGMKIMIPLLINSGLDAKAVYNKLVNELGYEDLAAELLTLLQKEGLNVGEWNDWEKIGSCDSMCGLSTRRMRRTCATGNDCLGVSEGIEVCDEPFDKAEFEECNTRLDGTTQTLPKTPVSPDVALETVCRGKSGRAVFDYYRIKNKHTGLALALNKTNMAMVMVEEENMNSEENHNQLWRLEASSVDGKQLLVCKHYGRTLRVEDEGQTLVEWQLSTRIAQERGFLAVDAQACSSSSTSGNVVFYPQSQRSGCDQWEITKVEEGGSEFTTAAPMATTTAKPAPRNIQEFLTRHQLGHLFSYFAQNGITLDFLPELTREDIRDIGITNFADVSRLRRAINTLRL